MNNIKFKYSSLNKSRRRYTILRCCKMYNSIRFTLVELIIALTVFVILIAIVMQIFKATQTSWNIADSERNIFENARIALDVIGKDIQCAYYGDGTAPFWHHEGDDSWGEYKNDLLAFVSVTPFPAEPYSSDLFELKYQLYYTNNPHADSAGWILRSSTSNLLNLTAENNKWNFGSNFDVGFTTDNSIPVSAFTADNSSNGSYDKLIPYVTSLSFTCYDIDGDSLLPDTSTYLNEDSCVVSEFPYSVEVKMSLLDKVSWNKWVGMFSDSTFPEDESNHAETFRKKHEREFSQLILIGDRGQL